MYRLCSLINTSAVSASLKDVACGERGEVACGAHAATLDLAFGDCGSAAGGLPLPFPTGASWQPTGYPTAGGTVPRNPVKCAPPPFRHNIAVQIQPRGIH